MIGKQSLQPQVFRARERIIFKEGKLRKGRFYLSDLELENEMSLASKGQFEETIHPLP